MDAEVRRRALTLAVALSLLACRAPGGASSTDGGGLDAGPEPGGDAGADGGGDGGPALLEAPPLPAVVESDGSEAADHGLDRSGCGPGGAPGRETVYAVEVVEAGFFSALLTGSEPAVAGLALLGSLEPARCLDAHDTAVGARVVPGRYFLAVQSGATEGDVPFAVRMAVTTPATLESFGVGSELAADALEVYANAWAVGASRRTEYVVVDFTRHSAERREWVVDLSTAGLLWSLRVAHGRRSTDGVDLARARTFSNVPGSNQSSLGLMRAAGTYVGVFGPSFRIEGLEPGFNDNVCDRDIVMHPWAAVSDEYVSRCGWARPSLGCPAIDDSVSLAVRDRLARPDGASLDRGSLMLFWHPGTDWHAESAYLHGAPPTADLVDQLEQECDSSTDVEPTPPRSIDYLCD